MNTKTHYPKYPSMRYKPVQVGGLVNHFGFLLAYFGVAIAFVLVIWICVANGERIDAWFSDAVKWLFL